MADFYWSAAEDMSSSLKRAAELQVTGQADSRSKNLKISRSQNPCLYGYMLPSHCQTLSQQLGHCQVAQKTTHFTERDFQRYFTWYDHLFGTSDL